MREDNLSTACWNRLRTFRGVAGLALVALVTTTCCGRSSEPAPPVPAGGRSDTAALASRGEPSADAAPAPPAPPAREGEPGAAPSASVERAQLGTRPAGQGDPVRGEKLFGEIGCNGCHTVAEVGGMVGPELTGVAARRSRDPARWPSTEAYLRASIEDPKVYIVPGYTGDMPSAETLGLKPQDVDDLVAYLTRLR